MKVRDTHLVRATAREQRHDERRSGSFSCRPFTGFVRGGSGRAGQREKRVARREDHELPFEWIRHGGACRRQRTSEDGAISVKAFSSCTPASMQREGSAYRRPRGCRCSLTRGDGGSSPNERMETRRKTRATECASNSNRPKLVRVNNSADLSRFSRRESIGSSR